MDGYEAVQRIRAMEAAWLQDAHARSPNSEKENMCTENNTNAVERPQEALLRGDNTAPRIERSSSLVLPRAMPDPSGLVQRSRPSNSKRPRRMGIVAVSADVKKGVKERCLEVGMSEYISKPFEQKRLREVLLAVLEAEM